MSSVRQAERSTAFRIVTYQRVVLLSHGHMTSDHVLFVLATQWLGFRCSPIVGRVTLTMEQVVSRVF